MKRILCILLTLSFVAASVFAAGVGETAPQQAVTLEFSSNAAVGTPHQLGQIKFAEEVARLSNGTLTIKNYSAGELYTQEAEITAVRRGTLAMTFLGPEWFAEIVPFMEMFATPFFFQSPEHMYKTMNGEIGAEVNSRIVAATGVRPLSTWLMGGNRELLLRNIKKEVTTPQDLKGVLLRMANTPSWIRMGEALGAAPTPMAINEVYLALQTGAVDAVEGPLTAITARKWYEVASTLVLTGHYLTPIMVCINEKTWAGLSPAHQKVLMDASVLTQKYVDEVVVTATVKSLNEIKASGVKVVEVDQAVWQDTALKYYEDKGLTKNYDWALLKRIQAMAK